MSNRLNNKDREILREAQKAYRHDGRIYIKVTVVLMLDQGFSADQIAFALGIDRFTVYRHQDRYWARGLDQFLDFCVGGSQSYLSETAQAKLKRHLSENFYQSAQAICAYVEAQFGVSYRESGMINLLHRMGFVYKKTRRIPPHADPKAQRRFIKKMTKKAQKLKSDEALYFMDGAHPHYNTRPDYGWILKGQSMEIPANSGRKRVNINGLINAFDPTDVCAITAESVNAQSTISLFEQLLQKKPDQTKLNKWLADKPIELIFLPPYSPNLNLIERLWKFMKRKIINSIYYDTYDHFHQAILDFFQQIDQYEKELKFLMNWNFQIIR